MRWHEFVFSQKPLHRLIRHTMFWTVWWIYFLVSHYLYQQGQRPGAYFVTVGPWLFIKTFLMILIDVMAVYTFIYFLLPQFLHGKWLKALVNFILLGGFLYGATYFMYWTIFPFVDSLFGSNKPYRSPTQFWPAVSLGLIDPLKVVAAAATIRYVKYWWLKQQESQKLEREKINTELQLLKAQIQPEFLFNALNNIYQHSISASPRAPEMLLKLSELLSYMLYECDEPLVPMEKEIGMMKIYVALEKIRLNDAVEIELSVRGKMEGTMIAPFLLLPFIEYSFKQCNGIKKGWINIDIGVEKNTFYMNLANGLRTGRNTGQIVTENSLANVKKRLSLLYPKKHELKISYEREMLIVLLKIQMGNAYANETQKYLHTFSTESTITQPDLYASK